MLFTIAIPTYNSADSLCMAIQSAINQTYEDDYEILIIDNASTDNSFGVISTFKNEKIRVIRNCTTIDISENHRLCFKEAVGDYVVFCHSDDSLTKDALSIFEKKLRELNFPEKIILWGLSLTESFFPKMRECNMPLNTVFCGEEAIEIFSKGGVTPSGSCYSRNSVLIDGLFPPAGEDALFDWYMELVASFKGFQFIMLDRLIYRRVCCTSCNGWSFNKWPEQRALCVNSIIENEDITVKDQLIYKLWLNAPLDHYTYLKKYISHRMKISFLFKRFIRRPTPSTLRIMVKCLKFRMTNK